MAEIDRRQFLRDCVLAGSLVSVLGAAEPGRFRIETTPRSSFRRRLAERELLRGLTALFPGREASLVEAGASLSGGDLLLRLRQDSARFKDQESYIISRSGATVELIASGEAGLLYAVFELFERQGTYFGIDGESYPLAKLDQLVLPAESQPWTAAPRFARRGLLPWPDFLNCISVYNDEDFRAYFESMIRMRLNTFGMHVYTSPEGPTMGAESYLSFEFAGAGHRAFLDNSASHRWGYLPLRTSRYGMGGSQFYDSEVFGADATRLSRDPWEIADRTRGVLARALSYANKLGIATGVGFEPYQIPTEILRALPPEVKPKPNQPFPGRADFDIESVTARKMLEARLAQLLEAYPEIEYVWLWEDEGMNWESRATGVPLSVTPFRQAYDFLRRHAPRKRLVLSGWGGVVRHFEYFHKNLPGDVIFSCLNDSLGWDPVAEVFGKLEGRERWPIPWLEDDPAMWLPQFHVNRTERDVGLAASMGCQGILGIHWRHRIMDATAGYLAKAAWDKSITPTAHFEAYARTQAAGPRSGKLAALLNDTDLNQKVLNTGTAEVAKGHVTTHQYAADYAEGFLYWESYSPDPTLVQAQEQIAAELRTLAGQAASPAEKERLGYLAGFVGFAVPYTTAWSEAHQLNLLLDAAAALKAAGDQGEARSLIQREGVPQWMKIAPLVRDTMLRYQSIVANRNDLGQLSSMHNKFVRLALVRLRLSMLEYLGELPAETERAFQDAMAADPQAPPRLFLPTRPGVLEENARFRVMIIAGGSAPVERVTLHTRLHGSWSWKEIPASLMGRRTYEATVGPFEKGQDLAAYYASASIGGMEYFAPDGAPQDSFLVTLV
jgi:hypothetical protein